MFAIKLRKAWRFIKQYWAIALLALALAGVGGLVWRNKSLADQRDSLRVDLNNALQVNKRQRATYEHQMNEVRAALMQARAQDQADAARDQIFTPIERQANDAPRDQDGPVAAVIADTVDRLRAARRGDRTGDP